MGGFLGSLDPISAVLGGVSAVTNAFTAYQNSKNVKKQIQAQKEENALNRQFNHDEAELSRQYNTEMVDRANAYNTPQANVQRLMDAGLHPSLAYGNLGNTAMVTGSTSQQASTQNSLSPVTPDLSSLSNIAKDIAEISLIKAQTRNIDADSKLKSSQTELNSKELIYIDQIRQGYIRDQNVTIDLKQSQKYLTDVQREDVAKLIDFHDEQAIAQTIENNWSQARWVYYSAVGIDGSPQTLDSPRLVRYFNSEEMFKYYESIHMGNVSQVSGKQALIAQAMFLADLRLKNATSGFFESSTKQIDKTLDTVISNLKSMGVQIDRQNEILQLDINNYQDLTNSIIIRNYLSGAGDLIGGFTDLKNMFSNKPRNSHTTNVTVNN